MIFDEIMAKLFLVLVAIGGAALAVILVCLAYQFVIGSIGGAK